MVDVHVALTVVVLEPMSGNATLLPFSKLAPVLVRSCSEVLLLTTPLQWRAGTHDVEDDPSR